MKAERPTASLAALFDLLLDPEGVMLPRDFANQGIGAHGSGASHGRVLVVHHQDQWLDLVDLWNLRALGLRSSSEVRRT